MTPKELIRMLEAEGVTVTPRLDYEADKEVSRETLELLKQHKDDLLRFLLTEKGGLLIDMCRNSEVLAFNALWCKRCFRYQLEPCSPSAKRYGEGNN
jgi:hypothetical protein